jgi:hypothetical protein
LIVYVTATDKFYSRMIGKISKLVYVCPTSKDVDHVIEMIEHRHDLKHMSIRTTKPTYPTRTHDTSFRDSNGDKLTSHAQIYDSMKI